MSSKIDRKVRMPFERTRVSKVFSLPSKTQQNAKAECDINRIMSKYLKTGLVNHVASHGGQYGDFEVVPDYQSAMNSMIRAQDMFMSLPSTVRKRFDNDPGAFLAFVQNPDNEGAMRELGLLPPSRPPVKTESDTPSGGKKAAAKGGDDMSGTQDPTND